MIAAIVFSLFTTWKKDREILSKRLRESSLPLDLFLPDMERNAPVRVAGTAIFMASNSEGVPPAMLHNLKHNKVLHEQVVFLRMPTEEIPVVDDADRIAVEDLGNGFFRVAVRYGFTEDPDVPEALELARVKGLETRPGTTSYFLGRETLIASKRPGMVLWRERLFSVMSRNARTATAFFRIPANRVVELGAQIEL